MLFADSFINASSSYYAQGSFTLIPLYPLEEEALL